MSKLVLDLHPIYNQGDRIQQELENIIREAVAKRADEVEIIHGKGSGQLKKRILRFLDRPDIKISYSHLKKDFRNSGRVFVYFRWNRGK